MKVLVAVKRVIDYNVKIRVKADNTGVETANVTIRNWTVSVQPSSLKLGAGGGTVTLTVDGPNVGMLLPTETHALALVVPGGSPIPALPHPTTTPKLVFKFDRASLVGAIRAGLATGAIDPAQPLVVWLYDGNRPLGSDAIRIIP